MIHLAIAQHVKSLLDANVKLPLSIKADLDHCRIIGHSTSMDHWLFAVIVYPDKTTLYYNNLYGGEIPSIYQHEEPDYPFNLVIDLQEHLHKISRHQAALQERPTHQHHHNILLV